MEELTENEFDLLDELYFVQNFHELQIELSWSEEVLFKNIKDLYGKGYIKILKDHDTEMNMEADQLELGQVRSFYFLASKQGLLVHNGF